jgi:hypothetical protein
MLMAEIRGHGRPETQDDEDYLTSSVFGHLRYIPPSVFWEDFLDWAGVSLVTAVSKHSPLPPRMRVAESRATPG